MGHHRVQHTKALIRSTEILVCMDTTINNEICSCNEICAACQASLYGKAPEKVKPTTVSDNVWDALNVHY